VVYASSSSALATGSALTFSGGNLATTGKVTGAQGLAVTGEATAGLTTGLLIDQTASTLVRLLAYSATSSSIGFYTGDASAASERMRLNNAGNLGFGTSSPSSRLHVSSATSATVLTQTNTSGSITYNMTGANLFIDSSVSSFYAFRNQSGTESVRIDAVGNFLVGGTAARGTTVGAAHLDLFNGTAPAGTLTNGVSLYSSSGDLKFMNAAGDAFDVGYRNIPQNVQTGSYTLTLADAGDHIYRGSGSAATWTIPAASSVAYPIGTAITFINLSATAVSIAITTDTMYLSSAGTTGTRTLAQYGSATAIKVSGVSSSGIWVISGSGLT
jgi:hypothetical protein